MFSIVSLKKCEAKFELFAGESTSKWRVFSMPCAAPKGGVMLLLTYLSTDPCLAKRLNACYNANVSFWMRLSWPDATLSCWIYHIIPTIIITAGYLYAFITSEIFN